MRYLSVLVVGIVVGCGGPTFTNLGNGVGVPAESIENRPAEQGVSRAEARAQLRIEWDNRGGKTDSDSYGWAIASTIDQFWNGQERSARVKRLSRRLRESSVAGRHPHDPQTRLGGRR